MEYLAPYMSYDDWKGLGPVNRMIQKDDEIYDGTTRETPDTPNWAHLYVGGVNKRLGNKNHNYQADAFSNAHSQFFEFMLTLYQGEKGDKNGLELVREAAREGDKVTQDAIRIGGGPNAWSAVGPDDGTAKVNRAIVTTALKFYPARQGVVSQQLPKKPSDIDFKAFAAEFEKQGAPQRFRARVIENGKVRYATKDSTGQRYGGVVGVFTDKGLEAQAVTWMKNQSQKLIFAPGKDAGLWKAIIADGSVSHRREKMYGDKSNQNQALDEVIARADAITVFWDGDERSNGARAIAAAARSGKLAKVLDRDGKEMHLFESASECMAANMSKAEFARSRTMDAFSLSAREPLGRFALSLIHNEKEGRLDHKDINRLAMMGETINDIAGMAETEQGREYLTREHKISSNALRLLGDEKVMANARSAFLRQNKHLSENDAQIIGPEDYPQGLLASGQMPPYLFIQGPIDVFRNANTIVGVVGEAPTSDIARRMTASRAAPAISALASSAATIARVEGTTSIDVPVNAPQILLIGSGHAHASTEKNMADRKAVLEAGGVVVSMLPPEETSSFYDRKSKQREGIASTGNEHTTVRAAGMMGAMSDTVLVTEMDASKTNSAAHAATLAGLKADRRPTVINYNDLEGFKEISGNRALLMNRGAKAMQRAGFGNDVIESMGPALEGSRLAIDTGHNNGKAVTNLVRHLRGEKLDLPERKAQREVAAEEL